MEEGSGRGCAYVYRPDDRSDDADEGAAGDEGAPPGVGRTASGGPGPTAAGGVEGGWQHRDPEGSTVEAGWECPHEAHPESDRCVFHMPVERREQLGIEPGEVSSAFARAVESGERDPTRAFVGARFRSLTVDHRSLGEGDRTPIDLRAADVDQLRVAASRVRAPVWLDGATLGECTLVDSEFDGPCSLAGARVEGTVDLAGSRFGEEVFLTGMDAADVRVGHARFADPVDGRKATVDGELNGREATFEDDVDFSESAVGDTADFAAARFRNGDFRAVTVEGSAVFAAATFERHAAFDGATFEGAATFDRALFDGTSSFEAATFASAVDFEETVFVGDAVFRDAGFREAASFAGGEFRGGSALRVEDADFTGTTFAGAADFHLAVFRYATFVDADFASGADFEEATFETGAEFDDADVDGEARFYRAKLVGRSSFEGASLGEADFDEAVFDDDASFAGVEVAGRAGFRGTEFRGAAERADDADFSAARFGGAADFTEAEVRHGNFTGAAFEGGVAFNWATFQYGGEFADAAFVDCEFRRATLGGPADFSGARFEGETEFDETVFDDDVSFEAVTTTDRLSFRGVECNGGANVRADDANFVDADLAGPSAFDDAFFRRANFDGATLGGETSFDDARVEQGVSFDRTLLGPTVSFAGTDFGGDLALAPEPIDDRAVVNLRGAHLRSGVVEDLGGVYYDATSASVGAVELVDSTPETNVFDRFLFLNTDFEGFDFSLHRGYLGKNDWLIHEVDADDVFGRDPGPADLETTYLKAKNSAKAMGDNRASSEFFLREHVYRRRQYAGIVADGDGIDRAFAAGRWLVNRLFDLTCGYGERPFRVVMTSVVVVLAFGLVFDLSSPGIPVSGAGAPYVYSFQSFTTFVLGHPGFSTPAMNLLTAVEGFVGAFLIGLFVFALTRSVHR